MNQQSDKNYMALIWQPSSRCAVSQRTPTNEEGNGLRLRFVLAGECVARNFVVACVPTDCIEDVELNRIFWRRSADWVEQKSSKVYWFVMNPTVRTGQRV